MSLRDPFGWVGTKIDGKVALHAVVGDGGFGVVYRGQHLGFELPVAVKCLRLPPEIDEGSRDRLVKRVRTEARTMHRLSQRTASIVQALDVGAATSPSGVLTPYIVMEWLEGETLADELARGRAAGAAPRGLREAARLLTPVARALAIAHAADVAHRDIKPANLFLVRSGGDVGLKIVDFGIAKAVEEASDGDALTGTSTWARAFTPLYAAPEQLSRDFGETGPWTDVFAFTLVLIEVATGQRVLTGEALLEILGSVLRAHDCLTGPALALGGHPGVQAVLRRALSPRPLERFLDAGALWEALEAALDGPEPAGSRTARPQPLETAEGGRTSGENRVCTVLEIDLSPLASLAGHADPEDAREIVDRAALVATEHVEALGGHLERSLDGEHITALFGVPVALEDDAERAVRAALAIRSALERASVPGALPIDAAAEQRGPKARVRFGIATGRTFVQSSGGKRFTARGEAPRAAQHMMQAAPAGAVVIARDTCRLVRGRFNVTEMPIADLLERGEPLLAYVVTGQLGVVHGPWHTDFRGVETRLAGRSTEKTALADAVDTMRTERTAGIVTLVGTPGVGRTRLLGHVLAGVLARREPYVVVSAQASALASGNSYSFVAGLVRGRFGIGEDDPPTRVLHKLRRGLRWLRMRISEIHGLVDVPGLGSTDLDDALVQVALLLGASPSRSGPSGTGTVDDMGPSVKQRIAAATACLLRAVASWAPVVLLCDDIHWADGASLDLIEELLLRAEDVPWLAVCTARSGLFEQRPCWADRAAAHVRLEVAPLPHRHVEEMVRDHLRRVPDLPDAVVRTLADRAEGNPLILVETLHLLVDAGIIEAHADEPWVLHADRIERVALPASVQGVVLARLDRLGPEARRAAAHAAVVGRTFWRGALARVAGADPEQGAADLPDVIALLEERRIVRRRASSAVPAEREYIFAESATRDVAYELLGGRLRRALHRVTAAWLEEQAAGSALLASIALHWELSGDEARAATAYARAAERAAALGENLEALRQIERAIALHDKAAVRANPDTARTQSMLQTNEQLAVRWRIQYGDLLRRLNRLDDAQRAYEEARRHVYRPPPPPPPGFAADPFEQLDKPLAPPRLASTPFDLLMNARIDYGLAVLHKIRGETRPALAHVEWAIASARYAGAERELPPMFALAAFLHRRERRPEASWQAAREGLAACRRLRRQDAGWREQVAQILFGLAAAQYARGRRVRMERAYRQAARVVSESESPHLAGIAYNGVGVALYERGDLAGARAMLTRALRLKERAGDLHQLAVAHNNLAELVLKVGDVPAALDHARRAVDLAQKARAHSDVAEMHRMVAEAALAGGDAAAAMGAGLQALATGETHGRVYLQGIVRTLARACAQATRSSEESTRAPAREAVVRLRASLTMNFREGELACVAEECEHTLREAGL